MNNIGIGLSNIFIGLLIAFLCIPLVKRKIKMNHWYGMRISKAFESDEHWYRLNEYGGKRFIYWAILIMVIGIATLFLPPLTNFFLTVFSLTPLLVLVPTVQLFFYSRKL